jgi:hypothetical protein
VFRRWEMASAVPSFLHGCMTLVMASRAACLHLQADGELEPSIQNQKEDISVMLFSSVCPSRA